MHREAFEYVRRYASTHPLHIVEIGSLDINGSARRLFPLARYVGLDRVAGRGVDLVVDAIDYRPAQPVDMVICCEVLEHCERWAQIVAVSSTWLNQNGRMVVTCANPLRAPHSAIDGRHLREGEYYAGVTGAELAGEMQKSGLLLDSIETLGTDTRASGVRI